MIRGLSGYELIKQWNSIIIWSSGGWQVGVKQWTNEHEDGRVACLDRTKSIFFPLSTKLQMLDSIQRFQKSKPRCQRSHVTFKLIKKKKPFWLKSCFTMTWKTRFYFNCSFLVESSDCHYPNCKMEEDCMAVLSDHNQIF